jgi:hypothetical protein
MAQAVYYLIAAMRGEFNWADKKMHKPPIN